MSKTQWIRDQYALSPEKNIPSFASSLNTQSLVPNPVPQGTVPKSIDMIEVAAQISPNDCRLLLAEGAYQSLLTNIDKGNLPASQLALQALITTPGLSPSTVTLLTQVLTESTQTIPDPNWQAQIYASPAELAGYAPVLTDEVVEVLA